MSVRGGNTQDGRRLDGKVAIITGAAQGIGFATARRFLEEGASVLMNDINAEGLDRAKRRLNSAAKGRVSAILANVLEPTQVGEVVAGAMELFGGLDILVNNVGGRGKPPRMEANAVECEIELDLCLTTAFVCIRAAIPVMEQSGGGAIVNISSSAGRYYADIAGVPYCAGKAGILALTRAVASECGHIGIRCNCVVPGNTLTEQGRLDWEALPEEERSRIEGAIPVGRLAYPDDIAAVITFLVSEDARYVTGVAIDVSGGHHMS